MDLGKALLVICITVVIVIGINAAIYVAVSQRSFVTQIELFRRAVQRARNPWQTEDENLQELARRVAEIKQSASQEKGEKE